MMASVFDTLDCGYCRAPIVKHDPMALKICLHRMTESKHGLAVKVLAVLDGVQTYEMHKDGYAVSKDPQSMKIDICTELSSLFTEEGISVEQPTAPTMEGE